MLTSHKASTWHCTVVPPSPLFTISCVCVHSSFVIQQQVMGPLVTLTTLLLLSSFTSFDSSPFLLLACILLVFLSLSLPLLPHLFPSLCSPRHVRPFIFHFRGSTWCQAQ